MKKTDRLIPFKKYKIKDLNRIKGGAIAYGTKAEKTGWEFTDLWFLFEENNYTNPGKHADNNLEHSEVKSDITT